MAAISESTNIHTHTHAERQNESHTCPLSEWEA